MSTMLNEVLQNHKPHRWDTVPYGNQRYRRVQVLAGMEYSEVINGFSAELRSRVETIYRVQNPYMYGRYKLKVEQLQLRGNVYEDYWYHPIAEDNMDVVCEYNCDYRRYTNATSGQYCNKKPRFYKKPDTAVSSFHHGNVAIVVVKVASSDDLSYSSECQKDWDTEYYPDYIVVLN